MNKDIKNIIFQTIDEYGMLDSGDTVAVAVSGGADSMLLLEFLNEFKDEFDIKLTAAHVEHGIRGDESLRDAEFVRSYCRNHGIEFKLLSINAPSEASKSSMGVEEYSRKRRYEFFNSLGCDKIATAHNLSDNVETVLFRMARGTGLKGMCGIPPVRDNIIRPLIHLTSNQIRRFCHSNNISYCVDSTNLQYEYDRNKIRNKILPLFSQINASCEENISKLIFDLSQDNFFIEKEASKAFDKAYKNGSLDKSILKNYDTAVLKRVILRFFDKANIPLDRLHLENAVSLLYKNGRTQIKGSLFFVSDGDSLRIVDSFADVKSSKSPEYRTKILNINEFNPNTVDFYCDCDKIIGSVNLRSRKAGDVISPAGRHCTKSLKKLFNESKVPASQRDSECVCTDEKGVIGVVGLCADRRVKVDSHTERVFTIRFIPED